jgi:hypothetical protein
MESKGFPGKMLYDEALRLSKRYANEGLYRNSEYFIGNALHQQQSS